jgi:DNA-binding CsgD family transcriptional regulator
LTRRPSGEAAGINFTEAAMAAKVPEDCPLTPRQFEVLQLLGEGLTAEQVARQLQIEWTTVRSLNHTAFKRLGCANATQAVAIMGQRGWMGWQPPKPVEEPTPLAVEHPFLAAYLHAFDRSGWPLRQPDAQSAAGMRLALAGHRTMREG